jgi:5-methylcytosine-specific restriction endonuclease McrA
MLKKCELSDCNNLVKNHRTRFCCNSHRSKFGAEKRYGIKTNANETATEKKIRTLTYIQQYVLRKQKRTAQATPEWANKSAINAIYIEARQLTESTGIPHEVDHIIPLTSKLVCGLHTEANLRILTKNENRAKSNKFDNT